MKRHLRTVNRNDRSIAAFASLSHGTFHGFELSIPLFVPIWLDAFDTSPTVLGLVVGVGYALIGLGAPIAGVAADRYGSKRVVLLSIGAMGLSFAALSVAGSIVTLAVVLIVWGAAGSLYHPSGLSLISRGTERRGTVLAYHGAGGNLGMVAFPFATIFLLLVFDWRLVAVLLAIPAACCIVVGVLLSFDEYEHETGPGFGGGEADDPVARFRAFLAESRGLLVGGFVFVLAIQMVYGVYYRGIFTFLPDVLAALPIFEPIVVGDQEVESGQFAYTGLLLVGVLGQYAGGVYSDRVDPERALIATFVVLVGATALFVPAASAGVLALLVICGVLGFFIYAFAPIVQVLVSEYVADDRHGLSFGYVYLGTFGVGAVGAVVAGAALDYGGDAALFAALTALVVICTGIAVALSLGPQPDR